MTANRWFIDSETGTLRDVLLCPPTHYHWIPSNDIAIQSMDDGRAPDQTALAAQFDELTDALRSADVTCHFLTPQPGLPYQVYTRDSSQTTPYGTTMTNLFRPERQGERAAITDFYGADQIVQTFTQGFVEGGDIHIIRPGLIAVGATRTRTTPEGAQAFLKWFEERGWTTRIVRFSDHFLHLDVIFSMVADNLALACLDALSDEDIAWFEAQGIRLLPVSYKETIRDMGCNVLALGEGRVISPRHSTRINAMLRAEGLTVLDPALDQFSQGGGSVHCMTMPLRRDSLA